VLSGDESPLPFIAASQADTTATSIIDLLSESSDGTSSTQSSLPYIAQSSVDTPPTIIIIIIIIALFPELSDDANSKYASTLIRR
jgi:hypothetical protein